MPPIDRNPGAPAVESKAGVASDAAQVAVTPRQLGAEILAALAGASPASDMKVPVLLLKNLGNAIVTLAAEVEKLKGARETALAAAAPVSRTVSADFFITPSEMPDSRRLEQLERFAVEIRTKCSELRLRLDVKVGVDIDLHQGVRFRALHVTGQAPKDKLDELQKFMKTLAFSPRYESLPEATLGVAKYEYMD